ncbi:MAG TPA: GNAT family N-acetyltransferase [Acidobacteriaceae bacterium]
MTESVSLTIRRVRPEDAVAVADLSAALGYPATADEIRRRIVALPESQAVLVACIGAEVVGWIDVALTTHLQSSPYALIGGLVVKEGLRGRRIGQRLCEESESWARAQGVDVVRVTSRSTREDAHRFYLRDGYTDVKTSRVFEKKLSRGGSA